METLNMEQTALDDTVLRHVKSAVKKWQGYHRTKHNPKLDKTVTSRHSMKKQQEKAKLRLAVDMLAKEWLEAQTFDLDSRAFLLDKLLPTLILGLEKLLIEVGQRPPEKHFNPINYLAQYLMRNNPRYSNFPEASPYARGLRQVYEELRQKILNEDKLIAMKAEMQRKREEAIEMEKKQKELERRREIIAEQCAKWNGEHDEAVATNPVYNMLKSFDDSQFADSLSPTTISESNESIFTDQEQFMSYVWDYVKELSTEEQFSSFLHHMELCAQEHQAKLLIKAVWLILADIFDHCDEEKSGLLDRPRVLLLLAKYYDSLPPEARCLLLNPRHWPLAEIPEVEEEEQWQEKLRLSCSEEISTPINDSRPDTRVLCISRARELSGMCRWPIATPTGPGQSWDHEYLTKEQFTQLLKLFLSDNDTIEAAEQLFKYMKENFAETEDERAARVKQAEMLRYAAYKEKQFNALFDFWDVNCCGRVAMSQIREVLLRQKEFTGNEDIELEELSDQELSRALSRREFCDYLDNLIGHEVSASFDKIMEFLFSAVKVTFEEERRSKKRQQWLEKITDTGKTSGLNTIPAYTAACGIIEQDSKEFGKEKMISAYIGEYLAAKELLEFVASSSHCQEVVVGQTLHKKHRQVSFQAVDNGEQHHITGVQVEPEVYFFSPDIRVNPDGYTGSLVVTPIPSCHSGTIATLNVDSLIFKEENTEPYTEFESHECQFYKGVCVLLGELFDLVNSRRKLVYITQSCFCWLHRRCGSVLQECGLYLVEPLPQAELKQLKENEDKFVLRNPLLIRDGTEKPDMNCQQMYQNDNLFKGYLYQCVRTSGTTMAEVYGSTHWAYPVRNQTGCAVAVIDLGVKRDMKMNYTQNRELMRIMKLLSMAYHKLLERGETPQSEVDLLFDQVMLSELKGTLDLLNAGVFAELRSYVDPPLIVNQITKALLAVFDPEKSSGEWNSYKSSLSIEVVKMMQDYDPLHTTEPAASFTRLQDAMQPIASDGVFQQGSLPALHLYNWLSVCLSLLEHASKIANNT